MCLLAVCTLRTPSVKGNAPATVGQRIDSARPPLQALSPKPYSEHVLLAARPFLHAFGASTRPRTIESLPSSRGRVSAPTHGRVSKQTSRWPPSRHQRRPPRSHTRTYPHRILAHAAIHAANPLAALEQRDGRHLPDAVARRDHGQLVDVERVEVGALVERVAQRRERGRKLAALVCAPSACARAREVRGGRHTAPVRDEAHDGEPRAEDHDAVKLLRPALPFQTLKRWEKVGCS